MNITSAKEEIIRTGRVYLEKDSEGNYLYPVERQRPVALIGPAGIGKTEIVRQAAKELGINLVDFSITHHTRQSAIGLPVILKDEFDGKEYSYTEYTMGDIIVSAYKKIKETGCKEGILFIDEFNCASETLTPSMLQLLQCKRFGPHELPPGWIIVVAGNRKTYNSSVHKLDAVTRDRLRVIQIDPDSESWIDYIKTKNVHPLVLSYIKMNPSHFYSVYSVDDETNCVTARSWEDLSMLLKSYEKMNFTVNGHIIREIINDERIANSFLSHYMLFTRLLNDDLVKAVISGTWTDKHEEALREMSYDKSWSIISALGRLCETACIEYNADSADEKLKNAVGSISNCVNFIRKVFGGSPEFELLTTILLSSSHTAVLIAENGLGSLLGSDSDK